MGQGKEGHKDTKALAIGAKDPKGGEDTPGAKIWAVRW